MIKKGTIERQRERVFKEEKLFQTKALLGMKHNLYAFRSNNYYSLYKII